MDKSGARVLTWRASGILMHPTSLPGPYGVGDLGPQAHRFADFLDRAGQRLWQVLPLGPPGFADSPYQALSAFAGNPLLIGLEPLVEEGLLEPEEINPGPPGLVPARVDFGAAAGWKDPLLRRAHVRFEEQRRAGGTRASDFASFREEHKAWLPDHALFTALKSSHGGRRWTEWDPEVRSRQESALISARQALAEETTYQEFLQYLFRRQWAALRAHCRSLGIGIIGDLPIFVAHDSSDVWAHPEIFWLDSAGRPTEVAGVPPDYFSKNGQLWGNPLYAWDLLRERGYDWWFDRLRAALSLYDTVRLDHFIGFHRCWAIPARARTAINGRWVPVPGEDFFQRAREALGSVTFIAEDLGLVTDEVRQLREQFGFPGMRVLQFAFSEGAENENLPQHYPRETVVYTGTHDNNTTVGWYRERASRASTRSSEQIARERSFARIYLGTSGREIHWDLIRLASMSVANTVISPLQDLLGLGGWARMNRPGKLGGRNWAWRFEQDDLKEEIGARLRQLSESYSRYRPGEALF